MSDSPEQAAALGILTKARELIADPAHWIKGCAARTAPPSEGLQGKNIDPTHPNAACWCSIGALRKVAGHKAIDGTSYYGPASFPAYLCALRTLSRAIEPDCAPHRATEVVAAFNDLDSTEHQRVIGAFNAAIELAKGTV